MTRPFANPFGFKIDYDKAIADDEARIAELTSPVAIAAIAAMDVHYAARPEERGTYTVDVYDFVTRFAPDQRADRLALLGLAEADLRAMAFADHALTADSCKGDYAVFQPGDFARGEVLWKKWGNFWWILGMTEEDRKKALKQAKASLARHKRNKKLYAP